jgi:hypothetical protein
MPEVNARAVVSVTVRPVIVRACARCGGPRQISAPCAGCGNPDPPDTQDLGVQSAYYRNPFKRLAWLIAGQHLAARRARQATARSHS